MSESHHRAEWADLDEETRQRAREKAEEMDRMYEPGARETTTVPGTNGMVSGTAFADSGEERTRDERASTDEQAEPSTDDADQ
ncbi:hypothetical protein OED52_11470 [Rhodococcus sp. Z13]|uniref:Uncharacterized protein n=1 Tax=Rhodococcus sacchari TaxID=2962047 RepID=A0ACD4DBJ4_9NOCA|nr:hypothetical protein [Rhodococcus sp. Z13]UYP17335.1 hypothetical protein OED52_11470 [Rhodococcus sp. Z13]